MAAAAGTVAMATPAVVTETTAAIVETPPVSSDDQAANGVAPDATTIAVVQTESATTTATATLTDTSSTWQQGMAEPDTTSASIAVEDTATTEPEVEGVLAFIEDPFASDSTHGTPNGAPDGMTTYVDQIAMSAGNAAQTVATHTEHEQYHDGKLVAASSHDTSFDSEVSTLLTDETVVTDVTTPAQPASNWMDVSPMTEQPPVDVSIIRPSSNDADATNMTGEGQPAPPAYHAPDEPTQV